LLTIQVGTIHLAGCRLGVLFPIESDKSKPLASVVHIGNSSELLKLGLEVAVGEVLVDTVDKELTALFSHCDGVWILRSGKTTEFSEK